MNNTTESLVESELCLPSIKFRVTRTVVYTIVVLGTYFGNILILVTLRKFSEQFKGTVFILLGNLAIADLLLAIGLTIQIIGFILTPMKINSYVCVVKTCILGVSVTASGILLMLISIDRFCAIVFPMKHLVNSSKCRRRRIKLTVVWVFSLVVICIPVVTIFSLSPENGSCKSCDMIPREISLAAAAFLPMQFIINVGLCLIVIWRLKTNTMSKHQYKNSIVKLGLFIKVHVAFAICWSPYVVTILLLETTGEYRKYMAVRVYTIVPGLMNSAVNWIIYGLTNKKFQDAFKNVLLCRNQRQLHSSNYIQSKTPDRTESIRSVENNSWKNCETAD